MKFIKKLILTIMLIIIVVVSTIIYMGHTMYKDAINKTSISKRIEMIKSNENYTNIDDIANNFKDAIIAIEDHRFYSHGGIDFVTTTRSLIQNVKEKDIVSGGSTITQQVRTTFIFYARTTFF